MTLQVGRPAPPVTPERWYARPADDVATALGVDPAVGLAARAADERLRGSGPNAPRTCTPSSTSSPACSAADSRRSRRRCTTPKTTCWPSPPSRSGTPKLIWSTNPLERLNKEIKRRTDVVGVFPNPAALFRLAGAVLVEAHDEWQVSDRRYLSEGSMAAIRPASTDPALATPALLTA
jgi:mutator family transposase/cation transport ATPase-like protein